METNIKERFELDEYEKSSVVERVRPRLSDLMDHAPSDASGEIVIRHVSEGYRAILRVSSQKVKLVAASKAASLAELLDSLFGQVYRQLDGWKAKRFPEGSAAI